MTHHAIRGQMVGYLRVSSDDQNEARQLEGIDLAKRFVDKVSGKNVHRPELQACLDYVREGDMLVVHSMDRLARNLDDLRRLVVMLTSNGVHVRFVKESLTFTGEDSPMSHLLLNVIGAVAQFERDLIRERQREGIAIAKKKGVYRGGAKRLTDAQALEAKRRRELGVPIAALAREYNVSRQTVYRCTEGAVLISQAGEKA